MSAENARTVVVACELSHIKMQGVADLLLLSCDRRPVFLRCSEPFCRCREIVLDKTKALFVLTQNVATQIHTLTAKWPEVCDDVQTLADLVVELVEYCSHAAYLVAISYDGSTPAIPGLVERYRASHACLEVRLACTRLKKAKAEELSPHALVQICTSLSKNLAVLADICKYASEKTEEQSDQDQFKLCLKSLTATASCLISSIKTFKNKPTPVNQGRCVAFCEPVVASANALVNFAIEKEFIGVTAVLSAEAKEAQTAILGTCLSIVSSCIQLCKTIKELVHDVMNSRHRDRLLLCSESADKASGQLSALLMQYDIDDSSSSSASVKSR